MNSTSEITFEITQSAFWAPGLLSQADILSWSQGLKEIVLSRDEVPELSFLQSKQKRRLSQLTKMSLQVAFEVIQGLSHQLQTQEIQTYGLDLVNLPAVFASRYGEWNQTLGLLQDFSTSGELSPSAFSLSVHNTSAGLFSLFSSNKASYTSLAAGCKTFSAALVEALTRLHCGEDNHLLLVVADEYVPLMYKESFVFPTVPFALAFVLSKPWSGQTKNSLYGLSSFAKEQLPIASQEAQIEALEFYKWFLNPGLVKLGAGKEPFVLSNQLFGVQQLLNAG